MNFLFAMSISGSIAFLLYMVTKPVVYHCLTARWQYNFLKVCILFYLIPYQCFQNQYRTLCMFLFRYEGVEQSLDDGPFVFEAQNTIYITKDGRIHYEYWLPIVIYSGIWLCTITALLFHQIRKYRVCRKKLLMFSKICNEELSVIADQCKKVSPILLKRLLIIRCPMVQAPCTIGAFYPVIVLPEQHRTTDLPLYLAHELSHVQHHDMLWKFAAFLVILLHWYNPLVYFLIREMCVACEKSCDEIVTASLDEKQKRHYENLVSEAARCPAEIGTVFANSYFSHKKQIKERLLFMTRRQNKVSYRKIITALMVFMITMTMPVSVMAYEPVKVYHEALHYQPDQGDMYIYSKDMPNPFLMVKEQFDQLDFSLSNIIILDERGNQYPIITENTVNSRSCSHAYVSGTRNHHKKNGNSCTIYIYKGIYCKNCGATLQESLDNQCTYAKCPH